MHFQEMSMAGKEISKMLGWFAVIAILVANLVVGARLQAKLAEGDPEASPYTLISQFTRVMEQIRESYVDASQVSYRDLIYGALHGMLASLDEFSQFLDPDMYREMKDETAGEFGGLGIVVTIKDGTLTIVSPMEDTPGFHAGLLPGDCILEIDGRPTDGLSLADVVKLLRGVPGTTVTLKIARPKTNEFKDLKLTRANISVPSVKDAKILEDGIAYLRITEFKESTADALQDTLEKLRQQNMQALIIDLRNNPGGLLTAAIAVAEKFLKRGAVVVSTEGRDSRVQQVYRARGRRHYTDIPIAILINGGTASAAEIVAGALQDHKRAMVIGEKSFGKGSVQSVYPLEDGSAICLTTAWYFTPSLRRIHEHGIEPDIVVPMKPEDWQKVLQMQRQPAGISLEGEDTLSEPVRDIQLERAIDVLKGVRMFQARNCAVSGYARAE